MSFVKITRTRDSDLPLPSYESAGAAGMDVRAYVEHKTFTLKPMDRCLIPAAFAVEIPLGYEIQIRPRSGLALKHGVTMVNAPGTIDSDYRGEIGIILINMGKDDYTVQHGDRIAQMVLAPVTRCMWTESEELGETERGQSGFGSTGN